MCSLEDEAPIKKRNSFKFQRLVCNIAVFGEKDIDKSEVKKK